MGVGDSDPLLDALTLQRKRTVQPGAVSTLRISSGKIVAIHAADDLVDVLSGDVTYEGLPALVTLAVNDIVYWLNTGSGGLVLGKKAPQ